MITPEQLTAAKEAHTIAEPILSPTHQWEDFYAAFLNWTIRWWMHDNVRSDVPIGEFFRVLQRVGEIEIRAMSDD